MKPEPLRWWELALMVLAVLAAIAILLGTSPWGRP